MNNEVIRNRLIKVTIAVIVLISISATKAIDKGRTDSTILQQNNTLIWSGDVNSNGQRLTSAPLVAGRSYLIVVRGFISQGIWSQNNRVLLNDACYEFNAKAAPDPLPIFQNDLNISVSDGLYHPDHVYTSAQFLSNGQPITFWLFDTDYRDNSGSMRVEIYEVGTGVPQHPPTPIPQVGQGSGAFCPIGPSDRLFWSGDVNSNGQRITSIPLVPGNKYYVVVRGAINHGTWSQNGQTLLNDACYEFNAKGAPDPLSIFQNDRGIIVCDNQYHPDHIYCSAYFDSNGQPITFWLFDTDYRDNSGSMRVEIYEVGTGVPQHPPTPIPQVAQGSGAFCPIGPSDRLFWSGDVNSNGQRITSIPLVPGNKYYVVVRGAINQGTWSQNGQTLLNDACYEFNAKGAPDPLSIFQNDRGIIVCDNQYHPDHIYCSAYFDSNGQSITFWLFDTDYRDNSGSMRVEIYEVGTGVPQHPPTPIPQVGQGSGAFCPIAPADRLFWSGDVNSNGQRITSIPLVPGNKYYVVVRGAINQGTWSQNGQTLLNDACYEFNAKGAPDPLSIFQNDRGIIVCDNQYHPDHIYCSAYFDSNGQPITFWLFDTDYRDNSGSMRVEIYEVGTGVPQHPPTPIPQVAQGSGAFCPIGPSDRLFWSGDVNSSGQRITSIPLVAGNKYYVVVRGAINHGTWSQNGQTLLNDACYEFNAKGAPDPLSIFQNDRGIIVCDNQYHPDHIYCSAYFDSNGQPITFWLFDTDYHDNSGSMRVEIYEVGEPNIDDAIKDLSGDYGNNKWDSQKVKNALLSLNDMLELARSLYTKFNVNYLKFVNEINDQNSNPLENEIISLCIASAQGQFNDHSVNKDSLDVSGNTLITLAATNKDIDLFNIINILAEVRTQADDMTKKLGEMKNLLTVRGGDVDEIISDGQNLIAQGNVNPEFAQDGGVNVEFAGDGLDNLGDGLQDYLQGNIRRGNVLIIIWDSGNYMDDVFELIISGIGSMGTTPPGARRNFDLTLGKGTYTLTIRAIYTDPNITPCTFGIQAYDQDIPIISPEEGLGNLDQGQERSYVITIR